MAFVVSLNQQLSIFLLINLYKEEFVNLRFQIGTSSWGGRRYPPYAFTEQGIAMLSGVLSSKKAIQVNIEIMRVFTRLRQMLLTHAELRKKIEELAEKVDSTFLMLFAEIDQLNQRLEPKKSLQKQIGFKINKSDNQ